MWLNAVRAWPVKQVFHPSSKYLRNAAVVGFALAAVQLTATMVVIGLEAAGRPGLGWSDLQIPIPTTNGAFALYETSNLASLFWLVFWIFGLAWLMLAASRLPTRIAVVAVPANFVIAVLLPLRSLKLPAIAVFVYLLLLIVVWFFVRSRTAWRRRHWIDLWVELLLWIALAAVPTVLLWQDPAARVRAALQISSLVLLIAVPFWFALAVEAVHFGIQLGTWIWRIGAHFRSLSPWKRAASELFVVATGSVGLGILPGNGIPINFMLIGAIVDFAILVVIIRLGHSVPHAPDRVRPLVLLGIAVFFLSLTVWAGSLGRDYRQHIFAIAGVVPSAIILLLLIVYQPLSSGARFANGSSPRFPSDFRAPFYFGFSLLAAGALYFYLSYRTIDANVELNPLAGVLDRSTGVGALLIGFPYLVWLYMTKRREFRRMPQRKAVKAERLDQD